MYSPRLATQLLFLRIVSTDFLVVSTDFLDLVVSRALTKILKLFMYISNIGKTYICNENPGKNTGIFRCFFQNM